MNNVESKSHFSDRGKKFVPDTNKTLREQTVECLRYYHYAYRTEQTYLMWIKRYIEFYKREIHPKDMGAKHVENFLSHLASVEKVSAATQRQALNGIVFLYRDVLDLPLDGKIAPIRSKKHVRPPTVMTEAETAALLEEMDGIHRLMANVMYGGGLRLMECVR